MAPYRKHPARRALFLLLPALPAVCACRREAGAGDLGEATLFDLLEKARVETYPESDLPPEVRARVASRARLTTAEIPAWEWRYSGVPPEPLRSALPPGEVAVLRSFTPLLAKAEGPIRILRGDAPIAPWEPGRSPLPRDALWWDEPRGRLLAFTESPPEGIRLELWVDSSKEIGDLERHYRVAGVEHPAGERCPLPRPAELVRQVSLGEVSRRCLLLPAPASVVFPIGRLEADSLDVAIGVVGRAFRPKGEGLEPSDSGSDGVDFALEVVEGDRTTRIGSVFVPPEKVGEWFGELSVDLRPYRGRIVGLRLVTDPGPSGGSAFDYAAWGGLRFSPSRRARADRRPHVILLDVDTLRPDRLGCYGYFRRTSPRIDAWAAANAVVYREALAPSSWTLPSTASMRTGFAPHQHRLFSYPGAIPEEAPALAERLHRRGYATYGLVEGPFLAGCGFDRGFQLYAASTAAEASWEAPLALVRKIKREVPFYLFLHTYLVHAPYLADASFEDPSRPYRGSLADIPIDYENVIDPFLRGTLELDSEDRAHLSRRYDGNVARLDGFLGDFLERLEEELRGEPFLLILTSDHGEELFEHGQLGHGHSLYGELLRVPLIVRYPDGGRAGLPGGSDVPASLLDIVPTVLDVVGAAETDPLPGVSLRRAVPRERVRVAEMEGAACVQVGRWKLLLGSLEAPRWRMAGEELYDLREDPAERRNLASLRPEIVSSLKEALRRYREEHVPFEPGVPRGRSPSSEEIEALRGLGYLGRPR